nr:hypothetical protein [Mycobacterium stomatepiae]
MTGGPELTPACNVRVASERAMFGSFQARRGFHHGDGGIRWLVNTYGVGVAFAIRQGCPESREAYSGKACYIG